jgi:uncharacterized phage protein (TIGR01671 family)
MREILFRGKRLDNGEWVEGSLHIEWVETRKDGSRNKDYRILGMRGECYYVDSDTVGQYTMLWDKNGKKIFEGDIIKDDWRKIYRVIFTTKSCGFMAECAVAPNEYEKGCYRFGDAWCETIAVIGNIHDNPELLKGE